MNTGNVAEPQVTRYMGTLEDATKCRPDRGVEVHGRGVSAAAMMDAGLVVNRY